MSKLAKMLYGGIEYNTSLEKGLLNDTALNDEWVLPSILSLGVLGYIYSGLLNPFNLKGNIKSLPYLYEKSKVWGKPYLKYIGTPKKAMNYLKKMKKGFVPNADGEGTDFVWGKYIPPKNEGEKGKGFGIEHIWGRRDEQGYNGFEFLDKIPNLFESGNKYNKGGHTDRYYRGNDEMEAIIRKDYDKKPWEWLNSSYYLYK